jgi:hypothetical protein
MKDFFYKKTNIYLIAYLLQNAQIDAVRFHSQYNFATAVLYIECATARLIAYSKNLLKCVQKVSSIFKLWKIDNVCTEQRI